MKKILILIFTSSLLYSYNDGIDIGGINNTSSDIIQGSGHLVNQSFTLKDFNKVNIDTSIDIVIQKSLKSEYSISIDNNLLSLISVKNVGNTLVISSKGSYQTTNNIKIILKTKNLNYLLANTSSNIELNGLNEDSLLLNLDGTVTLSATSGNVNSLTIQARGTSEVNLASLNVKKALIEANDSSEIEVSVSRELNAKALDNATILYHGNVKLLKQIEDNGEVIHN